MDAQCDKVATVVVLLYNMIPQQIEVIGLEQMRSASCGSICDSWYSYLDLTATVGLHYITWMLQTTKLVFASSSSVYGRRSPTPFHVPWSASSHAVSAWDAASPAANMYAATKKTGEALVDLFCRTYRPLQQSLPVGLRFFTVYGPWGRPDMAVYAFADAMMRRQQLPLFHAGCVPSAHARS